MAGGPAGVCPGPDQGRALEQEVGPELRAGVSPLWPTPWGLRLLGHTFCLTLEEPWDPGQGCAEKEGSADQKSQYTDLAPSGAEADGLAPPGPVLRSLSTPKGRTPALQDAKKRTASPRVWRGRPAEAAWGGGAQVAPKVPAGGLGSGAAPPPAAVAPGSSLPQPFPARACCARNEKNLKYKQISQRHPRLLSPSRRSSSPAPAAPASWSGGWEAGLGFGLRGRGPQ